MAESSGDRDPAASADFLRLRWQIKEGPIEQLIHVLEDAEDSHSAKTPFQDTFGQLHAISEKPFSEPPMSHFMVRIDQIDGRQSWKRSCEDDYEEDQGDEFDLETALPVGWKGPYLEISSRGEFITIGEYVAAVHPWLVSLQPKYLREIGLMFEQDFSPDVELWLNVIRIADLMILNSDWRMWMRDGNDCGICRYGT